MHKSTDHQKPGPKALEFPNLSSTILYYLGTCPQLSWSILNANKSKQLTFSIQLESIISNNLNILYFPEPLYLFLCIKETEKRSYLQTCDSITFYLFFFFFLFFLFPPNNSKWIRHIYIQNTKTVYNYSIKHWSSKEISHSFLCALRDGSGFCN